MVQKLEADYKVVEGLASDMVATGHMDADDSQTVQVQAEYTENAHAAFDAELVAQNMHCFH